MHKAYAIALAGLGAVMLTGAAAAASRDTHTLNVPLPDGSIAKVEYIGNVAPRVTIATAPAASPFAPFDLFDRSAFDMSREIDAMMRDVDRITRQPLAGTQGLNVASYANAPAGSSSVTIVSTSNGSETCTRRTDITSEGPGKAPKIVSSLSGNCSNVHSAPKAANPT